MQDQEKIIYKKTDELIPYINNPRQNDNAVDAVASSIKNFGFKVPIIIDKDNEIIAGHTRLKAAQKLRLENVPCIIADDLNDAQIRAFRLADNKVAEIATWDFELLDNELEGLKGELDNIDMEALGFDEADFFKEAEEVEEDDFEAEVPEEPEARIGQIYQLGRHRLMCGDSTSEDDIKKLVGGNKIDMVFTDPPYNIDYKGVNDQRQIKNDKMSGDDYIKFISQSIRGYKTMYVCCSWQYNELVKEAMEINGVPPKAMIVWDKVNPAQHLDKYYKQHELIMYYGDYGGHKTLRGDIWTVKRERNTLHPTMKPIKLISMAFEDNPGISTVYDAFGGSGSTLITAEQFGVKCFMMELDEKYVDVIVDRYINYKNSYEDVYLIREGRKISYNEVVNM